MSANMDFFWTSYILHNFHISYDHLETSSFIKYIFFFLTESSTEFHLICIPKVSLQICRRRLTFLLLGDASLCYFHLFSFDLRHICLTFIGTPITFWILFASSWRNFHHRMRHPNCWSFEIGWGYRHSISPSADGYYALDRSYTPSSVQKGNKNLLSYRINFSRDNPFLLKNKSIFYKMSLN